MTSNFPTSCVTFSRGPSPSTLETLALLIVLQLDVGVLDSLPSLLRSKMRIILNLSGNYNVTQCKNRIFKSEGEIFRESYRRRAIEKEPPVKSGSKISVHLDFSEGVEESFFTIFCPGGEMFFNSNFYKEFSRRTRYFSKLRGEVLLIKQDSITLEGINQTNWFIPEPLALRKEDSEDTLLGNWSYIKSSVYKNGSTLTWTQDMFFSSPMTGGDPRLYKWKCRAIAL